ncbi:MAG: hypothetical protein FWF29_09305 [Treponema sp.]|nr:hypothetical protein [Treponema sp.]
MHTTLRIKTLFAICVFLFLAAYGLCAQDIKVGGTAFVRTFLAGTSIEEGAGLNANDIYTHGEVYLTLNASLRSSSGLAGAFGEFQYAPEWNSWKIDAVAWWFATPEIFFAIGKLDDSPVETARGDITGWGLNSNDIRTMDFPSFGKMSAGSQFWGQNGYPGTVLPQMTGFYKGPGNERNGLDDDFPGLQVTVQPLGYFGLYAQNYLTLNFLLPLGNLGSNAARDPTGERNIVEAYLNHATYQLVYDFQDYGVVAFTYQKTARMPSSVDVLNTWRTTPDPPGGKISDFYGACSNFYLQWKGRLWGYNWEAGAQYTSSPAGWPRMPLNFGLGWRKGNVWRDEKVVLTSRLGIGIPMDNYNLLYPKSWDRTAGMYPITSTDPRIGWDFVINLRVIPGLRLYVPVGLGFIFGDDFLVGWQFSPYINWQLGNNLMLWGGLRLFNGDDDAGYGVLALKNTGTPDNPSPGSGGLQKYNMGTVHIMIPIVLEFKL